MVTVQHFSNVIQPDIFVNMIYFDHTSHCIRTLLQMPFHVQDTISCNLIIKRICIDNNTHSYTYTHTHTHTHTHKGDVQVDFVHAQTHTHTHTQMYKKY